MKKKCVYSGTSICGKSQQLPNQQGCNAQRKLSRDDAQCITEFACWAPNCMFSQHLLTIIIVIVLCYIHLNVRIDIKSYAQSALINKLGILLPFWSSVKNLLRVSLLVGFESLLPLYQSYFLYIFF